jgi:hypothetical protein
MSDEPVSNAGRGHDIWLGVRRQVTCFVWVANQPTSVSVRRSWWSERIFGEQCDNAGMAG